MSLHVLINPKVTDFLLSPALPKSALGSDKSLATAIKFLYREIKNTFAVFGQQKAEHEEFWKDYKSKWCLEELLHKHKGKIINLNKNLIKFSAVRPNAKNPEPIPGYFAGNRIREFRNSRQENGATVQLGRFHTI